MTPRPKMPEGRFRVKRGFYPALHPNVLIRNRFMVFIVVLNALPGSLESITRRKSFVFSGKVVQRRMFGQKCLRAGLGLNYTFIRFYLLMYQFEIGFVLVCGILAVFPGSPESDTRHKSFCFFGRKFTTLTLSRRSLFGTSTQIYAAIGANFGISSRRARRPRKCRGL